MKAYYGGQPNRISHMILKFVLSEDTFLNRAIKEKKEKVPFMIKSKYKVCLQNYENHEFHTINHKSKNKKHILYFHGGALCLNGSISHWIMIDKWVKKTGAKATYINYPMIPEYKTDEIYKITFEIYKHILGLYPDDEMILIGDSAGALVILSILQMMNQEEVKKPKVLSLISPWLDFTLSNPDIKDLEDDDKVLSLSRFKGLEDYDSIKNQNDIISPMDYAYKENIHIYAGTHDILYPDMILFEEKNPNIDMRIFNACPHVFPLLPMKQSNIVHHLIIESIKNL